METKDNINNKELNIDLYRLIQILWHRKYWVLATYILIIVLTLIFTFIAPKKYVVSSEILIKNSSSTNLSYINPFVISDALMSSGSGQLAATLLGGKDNLENEVKILKSPIVLDPVIKKFGFVYSSGPRKGQNITAEEFAKKSLLIKSNKKSPTIFISYKSADYEKAYNIVEEIIESYKKSYDHINSEKSTKDREFLEKAYLDAKADLNQKINKIQEFKEKNDDNIISNENFMASNLYEGLLGRSDKRLRNKLKKIPEMFSENKKLLISVEEDIEIIKLIKEKYQWSVLVENLSKNVTNIIVLKEPRLPKSNEFAEPDKFINMIVACVVSFIVSVIAICAIEIKDENLCYSSLSDKYTSMDQNNIDLTDIKAEIVLDKIKNVALISLVKNNKKEDFTDKLFSEISKEYLDSVSITSIDDPIEKHLENLMNHQYIILLTGIGETNKKLYQTIYNASIKYESIKIKEILIT